MSGSVGPDSESPEPQFVCRRSWIGERSREERVGVEESERRPRRREGLVRARTHSNISGSFDMQMAPLGLTERADREKKKGRREFE